MKGENKLLIEKSLTQTIEKEFFLNVHQNLSAHIQDNTSLKSNSMQTKIEEQYSLESDNSTFDFQTDCEVKAGNQILHQVGDTQIVTKKDCVIIKAGGVEVIIDSNGLVVKGGELKAEYRIKMSQTNNNTEIKEQDTQDEIIWEGKKDILSFLLYWITYIVFYVFFFIYFLDYLIKK